MKTCPQIICSALFLGLLTVSSVCGDEDFKTQFGIEFGSALKKYNAEMLQQNLDGLKVFLGTVMHDLNLKPRDLRAFQMRLESVDVMKERIGDSITLNKVTAVKNFNKIVMFELLMFRASSEITSDPEKSNLFDEALKKCADGEVQNVSKFIEKMHSKWTEMYATIPSEELAKHPEYNEINDSIEALSKMDGSIDNVLQRALSFMEIIAKISAFFNYTEWNVLFLRGKA